MIGIAAAPPACRPGSWSPTRRGEVFDASLDARGEPAADADRAAGAVFQLRARAFRRSARARCRSSSAA